MLKYVTTEGHYRGDRNKLIFVSAMAITGGNGPKLKLGSFSHLLKANWPNVWQEDPGFGQQVCFDGLWQPGIS